MALVLVFFVLFSYSGCAYSEMSNFQKSKQWFAQKEFDARRLNVQLLGENKNKVKKILGDPVEIKKKAYPYLADRSCTGSSCERKWSDEIWFYEFSYKDELGQHVYSVNVYFEEARVVQIY